MGHEKLYSNLYSLHHTLRPKIKYRAFATWINDDQKCCHIRSASPQGWSIPSLVKIWPCIFEKSAMLTRGHYFFSWRGGGGATTTPLSPFSQNLYGNFKEKVLKMSKYCHMGTLEVLPPGLPQDTDPIWINLDLPCMTGVLAQSVEHPPHNQEVVGLNHGRVIPKDGSCCYLVWRSTIRDRATTIWRCSVAAGLTINWAKRISIFGLTS